MKVPPVTLISCMIAFRMVGAQQNNGLPQEVSARAIVHEMDLARTTPARYATFVEELRSHLHGNVLVLPGRTMLRTREGAGALDEAIRFLRSVRPQPALIFSPGMSRAAADHCSDQTGGAMGHGGSDRSSPGKRLNRYGKWSTLAGENISYGKSTAREIVLALIIDDGLRSRKHRKNIFNPAFNYAGAAFGPHARYRTVCSIEFAASFVEGGPLPSKTLVARNP